MKAVLVFGLIFVPVSWCTLSASYLHKMVDPKHYDRLVPPARAMSERQSTSVFLEMYIETMSSLVEKSMDYDIDFYLRTIWTDQRLIYYGKPDTSLGTNDVTFEKKIWRPDLYFVTAKKGKFMDVTVPNLDNSRRDTVNVHWNKGNRSVMVSPLAQLTAFEITDLAADLCDGYHEGLGHYNCLLANITLTRYSGYFVHQICLPTAMVVFVSWIGFWITPNAVGARATLSIMTLLSLISLSAGFRSSLPLVAYVTAVDVWTMICRAFLFFALVEFAIAYFYYEYQERKVQVNKFGGAKELNAMAPKVTSDLMPSIEMFSNASKALAKTLAPEEQRSWSRIDRISRYVFPISFVIVNIVFWFAYPPAKLS